jgi:hypothetical protein
VFAGRGVLFLKMPSKPAAQPQSGPGDPPPPARSPCPGSGLVKGGAQYQIMNATDFSVTKTGGSIPQVSARWHLYFDGGSINVEPGDGAYVRVQPTTSTINQYDFLDSGTGQETREVDHVEWNAPPGIVAPTVCDEGGFDMLRSGDHKERCFGNMKFDIPPDGTPQGNTDYAAALYNAALLNAGEVIPS